MGRVSGLVECLIFAALIAERLLLATQACQGSHKDVKRSNEVQVGVQSRGQQPKCQLGRVGKSDQKPGCAGGLHMVGWPQHYVTT